MIPGKQYSIDDYLQIVWRRKWLIAVPFVVVSLATAAVAWYLPNQYRSVATIEVVGQRVPEDYVQATVTSRPDERLRALQQQILSRTRLEQIIRDFNLYPEERQTQIMEDVVNRMRTRDIQIDIPQQDAASFTIGFVGSDARTVMQVTERLTSLFINENMLERQRMAEGTDQFLERQLQEAKGRLVAQEKKLEEYRQRHAGELPSQVQSNLQGLQNVQLQVQALVQSIAADQDRRLIAEQQLADAKAADLTASALPPVAMVGGAAPPPMTSAQQLAQARAALRALEQRLTAEHPDITRTKRMIADLAIKADQEALQRPLGNDVAAAPQTPAEAARAARIRDLGLQMESLGRQIAQKQRQETQLRGVMAEYQRRLAAVPARESELIELTRDSETLMNLYTNLSAKKENARMAVNMEQGQIGEQFRPLDPARVPERPFSPNRPQIYSMGVMGGLMLGLALVALVEYRDTSLRTEADVVSVLALPVLALVPAMTTAVERQRKKRRRRLTSAAAAASVVVAGAAAAAWVLLR